VWLKTEVDILGDEWCEGGEATAESVEYLEKCVESVGCVVDTVLALQTAAVETDVPVCCVVDQLILLATFPKMIINKTYFE
jgi:hypothetical protein